MSSCDRKVHIDDVVIDLGADKCIDPDGPARSLGLLDSCLQHRADLAAIDPPDDGRPGPDFKAGLGTCLCSGSHQPRKMTASVSSTSFPALSLQSTVRWWGAAPATAELGTVRSKVTNLPWWTTARASR